MPPLALRDGPTLGVQVDPEGKEITIRQSWLNGFMDCPERARRYAARIDVDPPNDASGVGTAFHFAVETAINARLAGQSEQLDDMLQSFHFAFDELCENGEHDQPLRWVKRNYNQAITYGEDMVGRFHADVYPHLDPIATEVGFGPVEIGSHDGWRVSAHGSVDYIDRVLGLVDWKSASRTYKPWEKRRWAIQPTVYLAAGNVLAALGGHTPWDVMGVAFTDTFHYCVFPDTTKPADRIQLIEVTRAESQLGWLVEQAVSIGRMIAALGFDAPWPMRDQHALCSEKWCPSWAGCKGAHLGDDPVDWSSRPVTILGSGS